MKEKTGIHEAALPATREDTVRQFGRIGVYALLAFLTSLTQVYGGLSPFGVGAAAAADGAGAFAVYAASAAGYLLRGDRMTALRYMAAIAVVAGIRLSFGGIREIGKSRWFAPMAALLSTALTGAVLSAAGGGNALLWLMIAGESVLAFGFAYFSSASVELLFHPQAERHMTVRQQTAVVLTAAVILMSVFSWEWNGIAPGRIAAVLIVLLCAYAGREQTGAVAGIVMGAAIAFSGDSRLYLAVGYAFGGLLAGMFSRFGRICAAGIFALCHVLLALSAGAAAQTLIAAYEALAGGILFLAMPPAVGRRLHTLLFRGEEAAETEGLRHAVTMRLEVAAGAMQEVAGTVDAVSRKLAGVGAPDLGSLYFGVSETVCRYCGLRMLCWEKEQNRTMDTMNHLTPLLREHGRIEAADLGGELKQRCGRLNDVADEINRGYAEHRLREGAWRRLAEIRSVVTDQFSGIADMLTEFSEDFTQTESMDADAAQQVRQICEAYGLRVEQCACLLQRGRRLRVEILASDSGVRLRQKEWVRAVGKACGREFDVPHAVHFADSVRITLTEKPRYRIRMAAAQLTCDRERLCGDAYETFEDGSGRWWAVLSDGMGSGGRAAVDGAMAAGLTARLLDAGFGEDSVLRMVNSALMVKSGEESLATLDVLSVDRFTGQMQSLKAGAAASLLYSRGCVSRLEHSSLPVGILRSVSFEKQADTLGAGDLMLLLSDGALTDGIAWVEETLQAFDGSRQSLQMLTEQIAAGARERQAGKHQDDITVLALRVEKEEA